MEFVTTLKLYLRENAVELLGHIVAAACILLGAVILARIANSALSAAIAARAPDRRAATLAPAVKSLVRLLILGAGTVMALHQVGVNIATVLAGAGVLGLAIGFGAQALVRDVISGFFLIVDGVVESGDQITFGEVTGLVEEVGLRVTKIRGFDGQLWYVPNGELNIVGNSNRGWSRALVMVPLPLEADLKQCIALLKTAVATWAEEHPETVVEPPEVQGVVAFTSTGITVRVVAKVQAMQHRATERELSLRIKDALEAAGIEHALPRQVVYHRNEPAGLQPPV